jgi:hypothetical protein
MRANDASILEHEAELRNNDGAPFTASARNVLTIRGGATTQHYAKNPL